MKHKLGQGLILGLARTLRVAANNLNPVGVNCVGIVQLKVDILDNEGPNVVTESVGIEMSLECLQSVCEAATVSRKRKRNRP